MLRIALMGFCLLAAAGCDNDSSPVEPAKPQTTLAIEVTSIAPLPPDRPTHITTLGSGETYWVQEAAEGGRETLFAVTPGGLPVATKFSNAAILEAMGQPTGVGSIQALASGADQKIYFFLTGNKGKRLWAAFGTFSPVNGQTQILAQAATLAKESGLNDSFALARGSIVRTGDILWLWLRHEESFALFSLDVLRVGATPRRPFIKLANESLKLTATGEDLTAIAGNSLAYFDRRDGRLWKIGPQGQVELYRDLSDLPKTATTPVLDERDRLGVYLFDGEPLKPAPKSASANPADFPALLLLENDQRTTITREHFVVPANLNVRKLHFNQLFRERAGWLAYETQTGELLRLRVVER